LGFTKLKNVSEFSTSYYQFQNHQTVKLMDKDMACSSEEEAAGKIHRCVMLLSVGHLEDG
jgi:hypothetical protein